MVMLAEKTGSGGRRQKTQGRIARRNGVAAGMVNYPGAAAHTGSCRTGFRGVEHSDFLGSTPIPLNIYYNANWQAIETRTNGTATSNVTSQMVWSAAYINAAILQDTYSAGVIQPNSRLYFLQDANWDTTAVVGFNSTTGTWGVVQRYVYSPYGSLTVLNADWSTPPAGTQPVVNNLYQGMTLDAVTGLYYERFRNYSPSLGTWISQDPLSYFNGANTYQYVGDDPVANTDASGLSSDFYLFDGSPPAAFSAPAPPAAPKKCCKFLMPEWKKWKSDYKKTKMAYKMLVLDFRAKKDYENKSAAVHIRFEDANDNLRAAKALKEALDVESLIDGEIGTALDGALHSIEVSIKVYEAQVNALRNDAISLEAARIKAIAQTDQAGAAYNALLARTYRDSERYSEDSYMCGVK